jgi:hypothetical protein
MTRVFLVLSRAGLTLGPSKGNEGPVRSSYVSDASIGGGKYCSPDESAEFITFSTTSWLLRLHENRR